jgi:hypothetical protein
MSFSFLLGLNNLERIPRVEPVRDRAVKQRHVKSGT